MGVVEQQKSNSSTIVFGVVIAVMLVALCGGFVIVGSLFWVQSSRLQVQKVLAAEQRAVAEARAAAMHAEMALAKPNVAVTCDIALDRDGAIKLNGAEIELKDLRRQLLEIKKGDTLSVKINADSQCPVKHVAPIVDLCNKLGDVNCSIATTETVEASADETTAEN